jgi:hypothetical protein
MTNEKRPAETERDQHLTTPSEFQNGGPTTTRSRGQWGENPMRKSVVLLAAITLIAAAAAFTTPAAATEVQEVVKLCDNNPNCKYGPPDSTGAMLLNVTTSKGTTYIDCPPKGDCHILRRAPGGNVTDVVSGLETRGGGPGRGPRAGSSPKGYDWRPLSSRGIEVEPPASAPTGQEEKATAPK